MRLPSPLRVLRPQQWYKNLVVLVPLVFSNHLASSGLWPSVGLTLAGFCALSAATYAWNDVLDAPSDRLHPKKRDRPVASGRLLPATALGIGAASAGLGLAAVGAVNVPTFFLGVAFLLLNVSYNAFLKHQVIWDVLVIGAGFVLRALAGTTAIDVGPPTVWLVLCTFLFALFLAFGKRRHELQLLGADAGARAAAHRSVLGHYSVDLIEQMTNISATLLLASYFLYTALGPEPWMMFTIPFSIYGAFRYLYLIRRRDIGDEPELIFTDVPTLVNAAAWLLVVLLVLEGAPQRFLGWLQAI